MTERRRSAKTLLKLSGARRRGFFGPATVLAAVVGMGLLWSANHPPPGPIIFPSHVVSSGGLRRLAPAVQELLSQNASLHLTPQQQAGVRNLGKAEAARAEILAARIDIDRAQFGRFIQAASQRGGASIAELQHENGAIVADSIELSQIRAQFWNRALLLLSPAQRKAAERLVGLAGRPRMEKKGQP